MQNLYTNHRNTPMKQFVHQGCLVLAPGLLGSCTNWMSIANTHWFFLFFKGWFCEIFVWHSSCLVSLHIIRVWVFKLTYTLQKFTSFFKSSHNSTLLIYSFNEVHAETKWSIFISGLELRYPKFQNMWIRLLSLIQFFKHIKRAIHLVLWRCLFGFPCHREDSGSKSGQYDFKQKNPVFAPL